MVKGMLWQCFHALEQKWETGGGVAFVVMWEGDGGGCAICLLKRWILRKFSLILRLLVGYNHCQGVGDAGKVVFGENIPKKDFFVRVKIGKFARKLQNVV